MWWNFPTDKSDDDMMSFLWKRSFRARTPVHQLYFCVDYKVDWFSEETNFRKKFCSTTDKRGFGRRTNKNDETLYLLEIPQLVDEEPPYTRNCIVVVLTAMLAVAKVGTDFPKFHIAVYVPIWSWWATQDSLITGARWALMGFRWFYERPKCHAALICIVSGKVTCCNCVFRNVKVFLW